ncbi:MAG TPA: hypothetical protein VG755_21735, partial [Nannocystaceae bacterium]|nr:hypothetical protein [Nannocystaceae bacterium]
SIVGENPRTIYSRLRAARARVASELEQLQLPVDESIVAARVRPSVPAERAQRVWAGVVLAISSGVAPVPIAAGLSLFAKLAIAGGVAASLGVVAIVAPSDPPPEPVIAKPRAEPTHVATTATIASAPPPRDTPAPARTIVDPPAPTPARTHAATPTAAPARAPAPASDTLADEIAAIDRARDLLARDRADEAIVELDRYAARFADGTLRKDAAAVRVSALCKAGRDTDAVATAEAATLPTPRCR